jgi:hypothetical protein
LRVTRCSHRNQLTLSTSEIPLDVNLAATPAFEPKTTLGREAVRTMRNIVAQKTQVARKALVGQNFWHLRVCSTLFDQHQFSGVRLWRRNG